MFISKIELNDNMWSIKGTIDNEEEKDLLLWGECDGIPIIVELADYITLENSRDIIILIPVFIFQNAEINGRVWFELCRNFNVKNEILIDSQVVGYKSRICNGENYNYELVVKEKGVLIVVEPKQKQFNVVQCSINNHAIRVEIDNKNEFVQNDVSLYIKRRLTEKLYQFSDSEIFIGKVDKDGMVEGRISFDYFESGSQIQYYDFVLKIKDKNNIAEYFLGLENDLIATSGVICNSIEDDIDLKSIEVFLSNTRNMCMKYFSQKKSCSNVESIVVDDGVIKIVLSDMDYKNDLVEEKYLIIKKRTYNDKKTYCLDWKTQLKQLEGQLILEEETAKLLGNVVKSCDEWWDVFIEIGKTLFPILCSKDKNTNYFTAAGGFEICFFANNEGRLSVYTHERKYNNNEKTNIAVLGTCFSHCVFKSLPYFNPDYKKYYACIYRQSNTSIISLTSNPLENWVQKDVWGVEESRYLPTEFNKDFFEKLKESKAEYLLIDNYVDATRPIIEVGNGVYITYSRFLKRSNLLRDYAKCKFIKPGTLEYYELYKKHAKIFVDKVKECMPESHILLLEGRFAYSKLNEQTHIKEDWGGRFFIQKDNIVWDNVDEYLLKIAPDIRVINMRNTRYVSDARSPLGASPSHYQKYYYKEILDKINKIVLEDKVKG